MNKSGIAAVLLSGALCVLSPATASAQAKVFWTTSGFFGPFPIAAVIPTIPREKQRDITWSVSMWIIDHPKALIVFDTGNNAAIAGNCSSTGWRIGQYSDIAPCRVVGAGDCAAMGRRRLADFNLTH